MVHPNKISFFKQADVRLFLLVIPVISAFNYYLTYASIKINAYLLFRYTIDTLQGYLAWWVVRSFIFYLDKKCPYEQGTGKRIIIQVSSTTILGVFVIGFTTEILSWVLKGKSAPLDFYLFDLFIISIWFLVINGFYIGLHYYQQWRTLDQQQREEERKKSDGIIAKLGKQDVLLDFKDLCGFFVDGEYVVTFQMEGKKFYLDQSLDKLEKLIPSSLFFRLNRQFILHRQMIKGFERAENGKLIVQVMEHPAFPSEIIVSRIKAAAFKGWFRPMV